MENIRKTEDRTYKDVLAFSYISQWLSHKCIFRGQDLLSSAQVLSQLNKLSGAGAFAGGMFFFKINSKNGSRHLLIGC